MPSLSRPRKARTTRTVAARRPTSKRVLRAEVGRAFGLDPIITMNASGVIQSASDSVEQVFGWTPSELFGRNVKMLIPEPRRSVLDRYLDRYRRADRSRATYRTNQFDGQRKNGSLFRIELTVSRAELPAQAPPYFIGIIRDVSRQIDVEADGPAARTRLQRLVTEQTRALATANLRLHLADRLASLGTLAAGLGHDLNNVLLPVRARLNAIEHAGLTPLGQRHLVAVRRSITYLQHLSDGFHFLALDPNAEPVVDDGVTDLAQWWRQVGELLRRAVATPVTVRVSLPESLPCVRIASHWLTQAMLNLIVNAGEAVEGRRKGAIRIWAEASDDRSEVRLAVTDNGRGMARSVQRRAFDLFFTTKARSMGTGLGLPLARKIALRAGGDIALTSEVGRGTTAIITLNAMPRPGRAGAGAAPAARPTAAVLLDNPRSAALVSQVLISGGYEVIGVRGGGPSSASMWVATPSDKMLKRVRSWRSCVPAGKLVLAGSPPPRLRASWEEFKPVIIDPPDDFEAILHVLQGLTRGIQRETTSNVRRTHANNGTTNNHSHKRRSGALRR